MFAAFAGGSELATDVGSVQGGACPGGEDKIVIESVVARWLLTAVPGAAGMRPHLYRGWFGLLVWACGSLTRRQLVTL